jgi:hypothetical protein
MSENTTPDQPGEQRRGVDDAWNRVGVYMETAQATWDRLAKRNFDFWKEVAGSVQGGRVTADTLASNAARAMSVAQETLEDLWLTMVEPPQREVFVQVLPTAFLFFDKITTGQDETLYTAQDPVHIPVKQQRDDLPAKAELTLSGNPSRGGEAADAIDALTKRLQVVRVPGSRTYLLETITPAGARPLVPGTYDGLIYLTKPTLPLANLRVVVEGPPPVVDDRT